LPLHYAVNGRIAEGGVDGDLERQLGA
jgi:hypothetical protein